MEEEAIPFPNEESTPPVMKMYFDVFGTQHLRIIREDWTGSKLRTERGIRYSYSKLLRTLASSMHTSFCTIILAFGLALTSCNQYSPDEHGKQQRLRIWYMYGAPGIEEFVAAASAELDASNLEVLWKPCTALELQSLARSASDTVRPDIVLLPSSYAEMIVRLGISSNSATSLDRDIPQSTEHCTSQGTLVGHPLFCDMRQILINTNVVQIIAEDVDSTTRTPEDECIAPQVLMSTIESGRLNNVTPWGTIFDGSNTMADVISSWMSWFAATVVDSLHQPTLLSQQHVDALNTFADLSREGIIDTDRQLQSMFIRGQLGMYVGQASILRRITPGLNSSLRMMPLCGLTPNQRVRDRWTVTMATITKHCRDTATAYQILKTLKTCATVQFRGGFPTTVSFWKGVAASNDSRLRLVAARVARSVPLPAIRSWSEVSEDINQAYMRVVLGEAEPKPSLDRAQSELRESLEP